MLSKISGQFMDDLMLLLVLLQLGDTLGIFCLLLMTYQVVFCQGEMTANVFQLLRELPLLRQ